MFLTVEDYRSVCDTYEFEQITEDQATRTGRRSCRTGGNFLLSACTLRHGPRVCRFRNLPQPDGRAVCR